MRSTWLQVSRYRDRHRVSGAKSDAGDAKVLADLVRTDRHNHRSVAGDSELAEAVKVLARTHRSLVWTRRRQLNQLRSLLREFYLGALAAFAGDLGGRDALAVLQLAPTPTLAGSLRAAGRDPGPRRPPTRRPGKGGGAAPSRPARPNQAPTIVADASGRPSWPWSGSSAP